MKIQPKRLYQGIKDRLYSSVLCFDDKMTYIDTCSCINTSSMCITFNINIIVMTSSWRECHHEQQIAILQEKLMELHNKLIDQLDICKEQELTIIELTKKHSPHSSTPSAFDTFQYQSFGHHTHDSYKENLAPNSITYHHDSTSSHHAKTELLQADLEAMRAKVLAEITEKNKLKEEVKDIRNSHKKQLAAQQRKIEGMQSMLSKLREQNEQLRERCDRRRDHRADSQLQRMAVRLGEMQARYMKERDSNRELSQENLQLAENLDVLQRQLELQRETRKDRRIFAESSGSQGSHGSHGEYTKTQTAKKGRNQYFEEEYLRQRQRQKQRQHEKDRQKERQRQKQKQRERDLMDRNDDKRNKKRGFEQTKQLIKRLEQAEINMRRNRKTAI